VKFSLSFLSYFLLAMLLQNAPGLPPFDTNDFILLPLSPQRLHHDSSFFHGASIMSLKVGHFFFVNPSASFLERVGSSTSIDG